MNVLKVCFVALLAAAGCGERCDEKIVRLYKAERTSFAKEQSTNDFHLQMSWMPGALLAKGGSSNAIDAARDTGYYYFRLTVICPPSNALQVSNKTELFYGLDTLFATGESMPFANPVLVEPIMKGSQRQYEYLLVFDKKDFLRGEPMKVVFTDRLFTNTKQVFEFDRKKIDEIETLQCHAHEASN